VRDAQRMLEPLRGGVVVRGHLEAVVSARHTATVRSGQDGTAAVPRNERESALTVSRIVRMLHEPVSLRRHVI
jgi:hypothetical protein